MLRGELRHWRRGMSKFRRPFFAVEFAILNLFFKGLWCRIFNAAANYDLDVAERHKLRHYFLTDFDLFFALKKASKKDGHRTAFSPTRRHPRFISSSYSSWLWYSELDPASFQQQLEGIRARVSSVFTLHLYLGWKAFVSSPSDVELHPVQE